MTPAVVSVQQFVQTAGKPEVCNLFKTKYIYIYYICINYQRICTFVDILLYIIKGRRKKIVLFPVATSKALATKKYL